MWSSNKNQAALTHYTTPSSIPNAPSLLSLLHHILLFQLHSNTDIMWLLSKEIHRSWLLSMGGRRYRRQRVQLPASKVCAPICSKCTPHRNMLISTMRMLLQKLSDLKEWVKRNGECQYVHKFMTSECEMGIATPLPSMQITVTEVTCVSERKLSWSAKGEDVENGALLSFTTTCKKKGVKVC